MDFNLYKKIIDQLAVKHIDSIGLNFGGEPTLHPRFLDMIRYANSKGFSPAFTTNGNMLTEKMIDELLETKINAICFSLDGFKDSNERIRKNTNYDKVVSNIEHMIEKRNRLGMKNPLININYTESTQPEGEKDKFIKYWKPKVNILQIGTCLDETNTPKYKENTPRTRKACPFLWNYLAILWNGDIALCCVDVAGATSVIINRNVSKDTIDTIWNGKEYRSLRKNQRNGIFEGACKSCNLPQKWGYLA